MPSSTAHMATTPLAKSWMRACMVPVVIMYPSIHSQYSRMSDKPRDATDYIAQMQIHPMS